MSYIKQDDIFSVTNGGIDVILKYYPQAQDCIGNNRKFKIRESEKTASAALKKLPDGKWVVTDFGDDSKAKNCIDLVMLEDNCDFKTALDKIAEQFNIAITPYQPPVFKPSVTQREAQPEETDGTWLFEDGKFTEADLRVLFSRYSIAYIQEKINLEKSRIANENEINSIDCWQQRLIKLCNFYQFRKLKSYSIIKDRKVTTFSSADSYPIFVWEISDKIKKLYQPKSNDKNYRFLYYGGRPNDYIFGLHQAEIRRKQKQKEETSVELENKTEEEISDHLCRLPEIILASGGSDSLNLAALDYTPVWLNSETAKLSGKQYTKISKICERVFVLPDSDSTGNRTAHELCLNFLQLRTIVLPKELSLKKDWRGIQCKDLKDYLNFWNHKDLVKLIDSALPYQFWDEIIQYKKDGSYKGTTYTCNNVHLYWFLERHGFFLYEFKSSKERIFIYIQGNIVSKVDYKFIKKFVQDFLKNRNFSTQLRNIFYRTNQLSESSLESIPATEIDFTDCDKNSQWFFFRNQTWRIDKNKIEEFNPDTVNKFVWENEIIPHNVKRLPDFFTITQDAASGDFHIIIHNKDCKFFQFVMNTCRMHWRVEKYGLEDPMNVAGLRKILTEEEKREEMQHLINHIYSIGYLLHRYKDPSRAWAVWVMENAIIEDSASEGRSGKSLLMKFMKNFMNTKIIPARDQRITENRHIFENVTEDTDYVLMDDCNEYLSFDTFFPLITGEWTINPKNIRSFSLEAENAPKIGFSSNYPPKSMDSSSQARLLFVLMSDYYHHGPSEKYEEMFSPRDEFGKNLFNDFTEEEWNLCLNFGAQCLKAYLNFDKINPPMSNVSKRQFLGLIGESFFQWAEVYFSEHNNHLDVDLVRAEVMEDCKTIINSKLTSQAFRKKLQAYCRFKGFEFNPKDKCNDGNRILKQVGNATKEMIYIQSKPFNSAPLSF